MAQMTFEPPGPIRRALSRARIMVIPSRAESLPYVILEAAAAAQPLVSTDVGGIPEIYGPRHAERLIKANDAGALSDAIRRALLLRRSSSNPKRWTLAAPCPRAFPA